MDTARYWLATLIVASLPPAVAWWFIVHPLTAFWRKLGPRVTISLVALATTAALAALIRMRDALIGTDLGGHWLPVTSGILLCCVSIWIALRRRRFLTTRILAGVPQLSEDDPGELLTEGIYGVIRHPRYVEVAIGTLGYALLANYSGAYWVALAVFPALHAIVLLEEKELESRFGDAYRAYRKRVPRYVPRRHGDDSTPA